MPTATLDDMRDAQKKRLRAIETELDEITNGSGFKIEEKGLVVTTEAAERFQELIAESKGIREMVGDLGQYESLPDFISGMERKNAPGDDDDPLAVNSVAAAQAARLAAAQQLELKSIGQRFVESEEFKSRQPTGRMDAPFELARDLMALGGLERKDLYTAAGGTLTNFAFGRAQREPMVPRAYRTARVRDLFPVAGTNANLIEYVRVLGFLDGQNNAAPVAERTSDNANFGLKPHTQLQLQPAQSPLRTIAHYELAHRNTLADEPQLQSIIDTELLYGLRLVEDAQLLNGDGTGENILGILQTPGVQRYPGIPVPTPSPVESTDTRIDAIRRAATRVMLAYYEPTGVVVHPFDWERMELTKDANNNYVMATSVAVGAQKQVWQMPVVASPAMVEGTALVGAFGLGAKVYDREQANIRVAEQHGDLFIRNAVVILAEERLGLTVSRPESFVVVDFETGIG
jgi:HK97 family phage major capsid protein